VRAVGLVGHESAAMERSGRADTAGDGCRGSYDQRATHAITLGADLFGLVDRLLGIQEGDERFGIFFAGAGGVDRAHQRTKFRAIGGILEIEGSDIGEDGGLGDAIERVRNQHRVTFGSETLGHLTEGRAQAEGVGPD